jgi:hypothetical protein
MNSVYDAAKTHAEKLKAELEALQAFLTLHDHFRDRFGLTPSAATSQAQAPVVDQAEATHELHVQEPQVDAETPVQAHAPELEASESDPPEHEAVEHDARLHAANGTEAPATASAEAASDLEPHVINASEGVLIVAPVEAESAAPLGAEATLQSVAEKLAATISASHPSVTGYTV